MRYKSRASSKYHISGLTLFALSKTTKENGKEKQHVWKGPTGLANLPSRPFNPPTVLEAVFLLSMTDFEKARCYFALNVTTLIVQDCSYVFIEARSVSAQQMGLPSRAGAGLYRSNCYRHALYCVCSPRSTGIARGAIAHKADYASIRLKCWILNWLFAFYLPAPTAAPNQTPSGFAKRGD